MTEPFALTSPPTGEHAVPQGADTAPRLKLKQLRQRHLYWRSAGEWVGFGPEVNAEPDLFESVHRFGWWRVHVCRVCLLRALKTGSAFVEQAEALLTQQRKRTGK